MGTESTQFFLDEVSIDVADPDKVAEQVKSESLYPIARSLARNSYAILDMLSLPRALLIHGSHRELWMSCFMLATIKTRLYRDENPPESLQKKTLEEAQGLFNEKLKMDYTRTTAAKQATAELESIMSNSPAIRAAIRTLLLAAVSAGWTAFETVSADAWQVALNQRPISLGQRAFGQAADDLPPEEISRKSVAVGILAKYEYDLRGKLGYILKTKYDFTSVSGVRKAYNATFGSLESFETLLDNPELKKLEATRHLIVHNSAVIDEEFIRRARSNGNIGEELPMDGRIASQLINAGVIAGRQLLQLVDDYLTTTTADTR